MYHPIPEYSTKQKIVVPRSPTPSSEEEEEDEYGEEYGDEVSPKHRSYYRKAPVAKAPYKSRHKEKQAFKKKIINLPFQYTNMKVPTDRVQSAVSSTKNRGATNFS